MAHSQSRFTQWLGEQAPALAGGSKTEAPSRTPKVAGSIPGQGTYLDCGFNPRLGSRQESADQCVCLTPMFLSFSLSPFLSL